MQRGQERRRAVIARYNPGAAVAVRAPPSEQAQPMFERLTANWRGAVSHCVEESSEDSYATAWRHYLAMCTSLDCNPLLRLTFPTYVRRLRARALPMTPRQSWCL